MANKRIFTPEVIEFIKNNAIGISSKDLTILVNKNFNTNYTQSQIKNFKGARKIKSGYKYIPHNIPKPPAAVGTEIINQGYIKVKIAEPSVWVNKGVAGFIFHLFLPFLRQPVLKTGCCAV